jgi:putative acetyltransferase
MESVIGMPIIYRLELPGDIAAIQAVNRAAFSTDAEARLVDALRASGRLIVSLVADDAGQIVGHVAFSPVTLSAAHPAADGIGLAPLAVVPAHQRLGIGSRLVCEGLAACAGAGFAFVVVLGDPGYYSRFGFVRARDHSLDNEYGVDEEFMVLALRPGGIPTAQGVVHYAPEFAQVE